MLCKKKSISDRLDVLPEKYYWKTMSEAGNCEKQRFGPLVVGKEIIRENLKYGPGGECRMQNGHSMEWNEQYWKKQVNKDNY